MTATTVEGHTSKTGKLGLLSLTALVIGSMIGGGVFSLPQNMAAGAGAGAALIGWAITGVGMLALALVYQELANRKPTLDAGPYAYAKAGFGDFVGFNSAWGYWLSAWIGNVSYAVLIFGALGYFYPVFGEGNSWQAILGASIVLWIVHGLILSGIREAALVNVVTTLAKLVPIIVFVLAVATVFQFGQFRGDFWGTPSLGAIFDQVKSTMLVTLWVFIGVEGASVFSARARSKSDVGRSTVIGFLAALAVYMLVSLLSMGAMSQADLASLKNPSMAGVLEQVVGPWGSALVSIGVVISVGGAFLSWTLLAAEIPFVAAKDGTMPRFFAGENAKGSPATSLWITNGFVQIFLIVAYYYQSTYQALFYIASTAILVPYVFSGAYALKLALSGEAYRAAESRMRDVVLGLIATLYGAWLVYAAGPAYLLMCALLYAPGILLYWFARRERSLPAFRPLEVALAVGLVAAAIVAAFMMYRGAISPL
jgi:arginine:ornithine antiporter/lysine permease